MSKELFEKHREEEIHTMVSMSYVDYYNIKTEYPLLEWDLIKHYIPSNRERFKKDKRWSELQQTINECKAEQREIESEIRVNG